MNFIGNIYWSRPKSSQDYSPPPQYRDAKAPLPSPRPYTPTPVLKEETKNTTESKESSKSKDRVSILPKFASKTLN